MTLSGARKPFLVVDVFAEREPNEKRPLALGADATRRMKRDALALIALGDRGPDLDEGGEVGRNESWDELAV